MTKTLVQKRCENCNLKIEENYGSGRFCGSKCARSFSTKASRAEINKKVSKTMAGKRVWSDEQLQARREWASKWATIQKNRKLERSVVVHGDTIDITYGELENYRKTHTVCDMCGTEPNTKRNGMNKNLVIDHCHKTMKFRGLLCISCNRFLGYYENSKHLAEKYLDNGH